MLTALYITVAVVVGMLLIAFTYLRVRFGPTGIPPRKSRAPVVIGDEDGQDPDPSQAPTEKLISP